jgi:hypothetical protein
LDIESFDLSGFPSNAEKTKEEHHIDLVTRRPWMLEFLSEEDRNNKNIVLAAVKRWPWVVVFASKKLKRDYDVQAFAIKDPSVVRYFCDCGIPLRKNFG